MRARLIRLLLAFLVAFAAIQTPRVPADRTFHARDYGAYPNDGLDDRAALQACIDAAITAGGGVCQLEPGLYNVTPSSGLALLVDGDYMVLRGSGEGTEIEFAATATATPFCGIAGKRYNTCTAPYTAAPVWVENLRLTCDSYTDTDGHDLIGICHAPWALVRHVGFEQARYHAFEVNVSRNVLVDECYVYGSGNFGACIWELDGLGSAGQIASGGTHSQSTPVENITIRRFIQRVPRTDLTIDTGGYDHGLLSHTSGNMVVRNVLIEGCQIIPHQDHDIASGSEVNCIGFDSAALPAEFSNFTFRDNTFRGALNATPGGIAGSSVYLNLSFSGASVSSSRRVRNILIEGNTFDGSWYSPLKIGATNSDSTPRTSITNALLENFHSVKVRNNHFRVGLNSNSVGTARTPKGALFGAMRQLELTGNTYSVPNIAVGSGWNSGTMFVNTGSFGFYLDHPQSVVMANNVVEMAVPSATRTWNFTAYTIAVGGYEVSGLPAHYHVTGNQAYGTGSVGGNMTCYFTELITTGTSGMPQWSRKAEPYVTGYWAGNFGTTGGTLTQNIATDTMIPLTALTSQSSAVSAATAAAIGVHDWRPMSRDIGKVSKFVSGSTIPNGHQAMDGTTAVTSLGWLEQAHWNILLGLSATTTIPSDSGFYVRLSGK